MATKVIKGADGFKQLEVEIKKTLEDVKIATPIALENAVDATAKEVVKRTKEKSPVRTGVYKKGWGSKKVPGRVGTYGRIVFNSKKPNLTHLLENGHFDHVRRIKVDPIQHIPKDKEVEEIFTEKLEKEIDKELGKV